MPQRVTVHKLNPQGEELWRYEGIVLRQDTSSLTLEAHYDHEEEDFHGLTLGRGDRFVETHYSDRWYNVFAVFDANTDQLKGWYCNIVRPATLERGHVWSVDLALDLVVLPDGKWTVLDEDEFAALKMAPGERFQALQALERLQQQADHLEGEFASAGG
jgi:protein associated with RNAse G/E